MSDLQKVEKISRIAEIAVETIDEISKDYDVLLYDDYISYVEYHADVLNKLFVYVTRNQIPINNNLKKRMVRTIMRYNVLSNKQAARA